MSIPKRYIMILLWVLLMPACSYTQVNEYTLKAVFLERFTRFIQWPGEEDYVQSNFTIAVLGDNPFGEKLQLVYSELQVKNRPVTIKYINHIHDIPDCEMLFISSSEKESLEKILENIRNKFILTVSDTRGYAERGVHINFYLKDNNIHFEINESAFKKSKLKINHLLLTMARIVTPGNE